MSKPFREGTFWGGSFGVNRTGFGLPHSGNPKLSYSIWIIWLIGTTILNHRKL
jgi:hypothetical protein